MAKLIFCSTVSSDRDAAVEGRKAGRSPRRIVDRPEHHEAPGAFDWDTRRQRDAEAEQAAERFLAATALGDQACWRCEAVAAAGPLGLCPPCHDALRHE